MTLRTPLLVQRVLLLIAEHAAQGLSPVAVPHRDGHTTATFREDGTVRVPQQWAPIRPPATTGDPA